MFWDVALDNGPKGTISSLSILNLLCKTVSSDWTCPVELCDFVIPPDCALSDHFLAEHTDLALDSNTSFVDLICVCSFEGLLSIGLKVMSLSVITPCIICQCKSLFVCVLPFQYGAAQWILNFKLWTLNPDARIYLEYPTLSSCFWSCQVHAWESRGFYRVSSQFSEPR